MNSKYKYYILTGSQKVIGSIPIFSTENQRVVRVRSCDSFFVLTIELTYTTFP